MGNGMEMIEWLDTGLHIDKGWASLDVYKSVVRDWGGIVRTVGIPIHEDDEVVVLGLSHDIDNDHYFGAQLIAKSAIRNRVQLSEAVSQ